MDDISRLFDRPVVRTPYSVLGDLAIVYYVSSSTCLRKSDSNEVGGTCRTVKLSCLQVPVAC
jgi:hypothetical protein